MQTRRKNNSVAETQDIPSIKAKLEQRLLRYLSYKDRSVHETEIAGKKYLAKFSHLNEKEKLALLEQTLSSLKEKGFLDDRSYVKTYITEQKENRLPRGPAYIRNFLYKKGLSREIIDSHLDKYYSLEEEAEAIEIILEKRSFTDKKKASGYLLQRGFSSDIVYDLVVKRYST